jgi:hypothetical protein
MLKAQYRILDICIKQNATHYINPIGGVDLYEKAMFSNKNIQLSFIKMNAIEYKQNNKNFVPSLSIIDVLMFNAIEEIQDLLNQYELL